MLGFSKDVLRYIIVAKLPNIYIIAHEPYTGWFVKKSFFFNNRLKQVKFNIS